MPATRRSNNNKFENRQRVKQYERSRVPCELVQTMMQEMSQNNVDCQILVPTNDQLEMMQQSLQRKSFILMGAGHSGKTAGVHWLTRNKQDQLHIIWLDCRYWHSDASFINHLLQQISLVLKRPLKRNCVMKEGFNFAELNLQIEREKIALLIVIKHPERLVEQGRPVLLYNIFEWMNHIQSTHLHFIIISREIKFVDGQEKRIKSRMNAPIIFFSRPRYPKIRDILAKRIERCARLLPQKEKLCGMLRKALELKEVERVVHLQIEKKAHPVSYYLKIFQLILAIDVQSDQKWEQLSQKEINGMVAEGFEKHGQYIVDHRTIARSFFSANNIPELIMMGLYRNRFLRQKEGHYTCPITMGQLMNDFKNKIRQTANEDGGNSFFYGEQIMERALKNLIDWNLLTFSRLSEKVALINRQIDSRYGPEDIEHFCKDIQNLPTIVREIYQDK